MVTTAIAMSLIIIMLIGTELGYLFYIKREFQKAADLAALAGAQQITGSDGCSGAKLAARLNANGTGSSDLNRNLPATFALQDADIQCGQWDPATGGSEHFTETASNNNAVRVLFKGTPGAILSFFQASRTIQVSAIAVNKPIAGFSVGTGLASLDGGAINTLLNALLGTGNRISLDLVSYKGLTSGSIRLLDLIAVIPNVGSVKELLDTRIFLSDLILAMIKAVGTSNAVAVQALNGILSANIKSVQVRIGDLIKVTTPSPESAASATVNLLELLMVGAQVANGTNAVNLGAGLDLGALAKVDTKLVIVEPPSIAIGEAGKDANGNWKTQAHSATIRLLLDARVVDTTSLPLISGLAGIQLLHLPVYIEAVPGDAWLSKIQCNLPRKDSVVTIGSRPGLANVCIADNMDTQMTNTSTPTSCTDPATISKVSVLGIPVIDVKATVPLNAMTPVQNAPDLRFDGVVGNADDIQRTTSNAVGSVLSTAVGGLGNGLQLKACLLGFICLDQGILTGLLNTLNTAILTPLLGLLDTVIQPLLGLLGVQLGYSDIHFQSLTCGEAKLVY